jgi:prevent-host-death family protein
MAQFSVHDAKTHLSKLIASAMAGEQVVITRGNVPAVTLVPIVPASRRQFGALKGKITIDERFDDPLPADELSGWNLD